MRRTLILISTVWCAFFFSSAYATAATAECVRPIDNVARIGWPGRLKLAITEDMQNRECRFSVGGVATGSPPQAQLDAASAALARARREGGLTVDSPIEAHASIGVLLAAASPFETPADALLSDEFAAFVQACFSLTSELGAEFTDNGLFLTNDDIGVSFEGVRCALVTPSSVGALNEFLEGRILFADLETPMLSFHHIRDDDFTEHLLTPVAP